MRLLPLAGLFLAALVGLVLVGPIPQNPAFHLFADGRTCLGVPNFLNVATNAGFAVVGVLGLWRVERARALFVDASEAWCYRAFFAAVALVSMGSAYYHAAPDNPRLFWDRLPMTLAFMALCAAFLRDRVPGLRGAAWVLPVLLGLGAASAIYWRWTESMGQGDLRPYALVQFFPMLALPLLCWAFPTGRLTSLGHFLVLLAFYLLALGFEQADHWVFAVTGGDVSGHSLKHLIAAIAPLVVLHMISRARPLAVT